MSDHPQVKAPSVEVFTTVHKGLRWWMGRLSAELGSASFTTPIGQSTLEDLEQLLTALDEHSLHEETFVVPLLLARAEDRAVSWQGEHQHLEVLEGGMRRQIEGLRRLGPAHASASALGTALYRTFNRFFAETLRHLDEEETLIMPLLGTVCSAAELQGVMNDFKARFGDDAMRLLLRLAEAYNPVERAQLGI